MAHYIVELIKQRPDISSYTKEFWIDVFYKKIFPRGITILDEPVVRKHLNYQAFTDFTPTELFKTFVLIDAWNTTCVTDNHYYSVIRSFTEYEQQQEKLKVFEAKEKKISKLWWFIPLLISIIAILYQTLSNN